MARRFLYGVAALVVLVVAAMLALSFWAQGLSQFAFVPTARFAPPPPRASDAYDQSARWIARGDEAGNAARWLPPGVVRGTPLPAAVFFVHPTTHYDRARWNAAPADVTANARADLFTRALASPFNAAREVWAPRYAQATFGAFLTDKPEGQQAIDAAYADVLAAFDHFLAHADPRLPIVIVGHSQGAVHVLRLLRDRVAGRPLARRVAAAYVVGWPVSLTHDLPLTGLPGCATPDQPGCVLSWQSYAEPADTGFSQGALSRFAGLDGQSRKGGALLCTNPLTGAGGAAPASANLGTLVADADLSGASLARGMVPARCAAGGILLIGPPPGIGPYVLPGNNYHIYDIALFWANIRADVARRVAAWQASR